MSDQDQTNKQDAVDNDNIDNDKENKIDLSYYGSRDDGADGRTVASRQRLRDQLSSDIEAYLAKGGKISQVDSNVSADPPKRPESNYGQRPI